MHILTKFLLVKATYYLLISTFILIGLLFALQSTKVLNLLLGGSTSFLSFINLVIFSLPSLLQEIIPIIALLATVLIANSLKNNNESTIMRAVGLNEIKIYKAVFVMVFVVCCANFYTTNTLIPKFEKKYLITRHNLSNNAVEMLIAQQKQSKFIPLSAKESIYIEKIDKDGNIKNMIIYAPSGDQHVTIVSESGRISQDGTGAPILFLQNATLVTLEEDSYSKLVLKEYIVYLQDVFDLKKQIFINHLSRRNLSLLELLIPHYRNKKLELLKQRGLVESKTEFTNQDYEIYNTEGYRRLLNIINCFVFAVLALYFTGGNSSDRKTNNYSILKVVTGALAIRIIQLSIVFNSNGNLVALLSVVLLSILLGMYIFYKTLGNAMPQK